MWMPQQIPQLGEQLKAMGLELDPRNLSDLTGDPMGAIVSLGGCSASFVSPQGLVVTNHHCVFGMLQFNSTPERDLITDGFLARSFEHELPAGPTSRVFVTTKIDDVTAEMTGGIAANLSDGQRYKLLDRRNKSMVAKCEAPGGLRCRVASFFEGTQYLRVTQMEILDVRLVYAPAAGIGEYGGETDNWMWPRHTGDFSFVRAYVGKDGKPAIYSSDNVPFRPRRVLKVSADGVKPGDLVLVTGYPGRTYRYKTAGEVQSAQDFTYPNSIRYFGDLMRILQDQGKSDRSIAIKNASRIKGLANTYKNNIGMLAGLKKFDLYGERKLQENELGLYIGKNATTTAKFGSVLEDIRQLNAEQEKSRNRDLVLSWLYRSSPMLSQASTLYRLSIERTKKDVDRKLGYQERDIPRIKQSVASAQRSIEPGSDRAGLRYFLTEAAKLPAAQRIKAVDDALASTGERDASAQIETFLDRLYGNTRVATLNERNAMAGQTTAQLLARNDAMIDLAAGLTALSLQNETRDDQYEGGMLRIRPLYMEALSGMRGTLLAPDANSTLRVTFGTVKGYEARDAVKYEPFTRLSGVVDKNTGEGEFDSPETLLEAARTGRKGPYGDPRLGDVPVNFLSTCDITGGNSGSPTLNSRGELVGLAFDGNYEAMGSDYLFNPELTRTIHVDARYMLWVMDAVDGAHGLLREMGLPVHFVAP